MEAVEIGSVVVTCENCGRLIGNLETPHVWKEHVVCADCIERLIPTAIAAPPQLQATAEEINAAPQWLFKLGNIAVTQDAIIQDTIIRGHSALPLANVLRVMTETSFLLGKTVTVFDLARTKYKYTFSGARDATAFIRAIQSAKPSVYVEKPDDDAFFVMWG